MILILKPVHQTDYVYTHSDVRTLSDQKYTVYRLILILKPFHQNIMYIDSFILILKPFHQNILYTIIPILKHFHQTYPV